MNEGFDQTICNQKQDNSFHLIKKNIPSLHLQKLLVIIFKFFS